MLLLAAGADASLTQENGNTPLLLAAGLGYRGAIGGTEQMALASHPVLERAARLDIRNKQGRTALESVLRAREHSAQRGVPPIANTGRALKGPAPSKTSTSFPGEWPCAYK